MHKPRRLIFFDRHLVKEGSDVHTGVQKLNVSCACGSPEQLWLGERSGEVRSLDRRFRLSAAIQTFPDGDLIDLCVAQDGRRLIAFGCEAGGSRETRYKVFEVRKDGEAALLIINRVFSPRGPELHATCFAVSSVLTLLAVGVDSGAVYLWRGKDLGVEKPYATVISEEGDPPVTAVKFLEQGHRTVLFVASLVSIRSWSVREGESSAVRILNTDPSGGVAPRCCCVFPTVNAMLVARSACVYAYDPEEGNMSAMPLEGDKVLLMHFKSYFATVTTDGGSGAGAASESGGSFVAPASFGSSASLSTAPKQTLTVMLAYPHMRFIAYSAQFTDVTHVVHALGGIFVVSRGGADSSTVLFELREKSLPEQLEILVQKRMFEWAAEIALQGGAPPETTAEIYRMHGDSFFEKRAYDQALAVYMKTVDLGLPLEPSYVVERYLEAQRVAHVAQYLKKLHEKSLAEREHTALLVKCYTKLKDTSMLDMFLEQTPVDQYDPGVAIEVLEAAGYYGLAAAVAQKPEVGRHEDYIRIALEHFKSYSKAVECIRGLPKEHAGKMLLEHGRVLMRHAPREMLQLVRDVCGLGSTVYSPPRGSAASALPRVQDMLPVFVVDLAQLELFLRSILLAPGACPLAPADAESLFPTLLELMLRSYRRAVEEEEAASGVGGAGQGSANELASRRLHGEIMQLIRQFQSEEALASTLMLSQTFGFVDGFFHAAEKLGRFQLLMHWCFECRDTKRLMEVCKRSGTQDQSLWVQALSFLASDEGDHTEEIAEVLQHLERSDQVPLLMVVEMLQSSPGINLGVVRPYLQAQFKKMAESVESSRGKAQQDRQEIARMQQEITSLRTEAQVFQSNKCHQCRIQLDVPAVYFFCGHSYHTYCVAGGSGCPQCSSEALPKIRMRTKREAQARNTEDFFKYLQGSSGDKQMQAVSEWCKFGAFDAGSASLVVEESDPDAALV